MPLYNLENVTNSTNIVTYVVELNTVSGGFLINSLLAALWVILFISFKNYETEDALVGSTLLVFIIAAFLRFNPTPIIGEATMYFWIAAFFLSVIVSVVSRQA